VPTFGKSPSDTPHAQGRTGTRGRSHRRRAARRFRRSRAPAVARRSAAPPQSDSLAPNTLSRPLSAPVQRTLPISVSSMCNHPRSASDLLAPNTQPDTLIPTAAKPPTLPPPRPPLFVFSHFSQLPFVCRIGNSSSAGATTDPIPELFRFVRRSPMMRNDPPTEVHVLHWIELWSLLESPPARGILVPGSRREDGGLGENDDGTKVPYWVWSGAGSPFTYVGQGPQ
jgi:hypothetical protein